MKEDAARHDTVAHNQLHLIDCMKFLPQMRDESVSLILTDPPYEINYVSNHSHNRYRPIAGDTGFDYFQFARECYRILKMNSHAYFFTRFDKYPRHYEALSAAGFTVKNCLVIEKWQRGGLGDLYGSFSNNSEWVLFCHKGRRAFTPSRLLPYAPKMDRPGEYRIRLDACWFGEKYPKSNYPCSWNKVMGVRHPTVKNIECLKWLVLVSSNPGDLVFDPFMGSGSTALAAMETGRRFSGCEIDGEYYSLCMKRILDRLDCADLNPLPM